MNPKLAFSSLVLAISMAAGQGVAAPIEVVFNQLSFTNGEGGFTTEHSEWFMGGVQLSSGAESLLASDGDTRYGYVNIVIADPLGSADRWAVRNLPVALSFSGISTHLDGRAPDQVAFGLNIPRGTAVSSLRYVASIDAAPRNAAPPVPGGPEQYDLAPVSAEARIFGGLSDGLNAELGSSGRRPPALGGMRDFILPQPPAPPVEKPKVTRIKIKDADVVKVAETTSGCAPGAATRALKYLASSDNNVTITQTTAQAFADLATRMGTVANNNGGTTGDKYRNGLRAYIAAKMLPLDVQELNGNFTDIPQVIELLEQGAAITMAVDLGKEENNVHIANHATFVTQITKDRGAYLIKCVDDPNQGSGTAANKSVTYSLDFGNGLSTPGGGTDARVIRFVAIIAPAPGVGSMALLAIVFAARRRR